jgi:hypothetical protein
MSMMNPIAGASGPGKFSARTDLPPSKEYGERKQMEEIQSAAPRSRTRGAADPQLGRPANPMSGIVPLFSETQYKDEPITSGIDVGEGPGSEVMGYNAPSERLSDILASMLPYDVDGEIAILYQQAVSRGL